MSITTTINVQTNNHSDVTIYGHDTGKTAVRINAHTRYDRKAADLYRLLSDAMPDAVSHFEGGGSGDFSTVTLDVCGVEFTLFGKYLGQTVDENQLSLLDEKVS